MTEKSLFKIVGTFLLIVGELVFFRNIVWTTFFARSDMALIGAVAFFIGQIIASYYIIKLMYFNNSTKENNEVQ